MKSLIDPRALRYVRVVLLSVVLSLFHMLILCVQKYLFIKICGFIIQFCINFCIFQQKLFKDLQLKTVKEVNSGLTSKSLLGYLKNRKDFSICSHEDFSGIPALLLKENSVLSIWTALPIYTLFYLHGITL